MHNYRCDKIRRVLRTSPKGSAFHHVYYRNVTHFCQLPASQWYELQSHTAKRSANRDEKNVFPFLKINTFYRHKEKCGSIHCKLTILSNLWEDLQGRQSFIPLRV